MTISRIRPLVSTNWLVDRLSALKNSRQLRVLDTAFDNDPQVNNYEESYKRKHIPGSKYFNIHECVEITPEIPRNLPNLACFAEYLRGLGVWRDTHVITYDRIDNKAACRTWWLLKLHGHKNVSVLDGGLSKWLTDGQDTQTEELQYEKGDFEPQVDYSILRDYEHMVKNLKSQDEAVLDCRPRAAFLGEHPDFTNLNGGHIPGAQCLPFSQLFNKDGTFKGENELRLLFEESGVDLTKPLISSCQTGMTACALSLAAELIDKPNTPVYYGSWTEWTQRASEQLKERGDN